MDVRQRGRMELELQAPLNRQTLEWVWCALASCGLRDGKIQWTEGDATARVQGQFSRNETIQAEVTVAPECVRLELFAALPKGHIGVAHLEQTKEQLTERLVSFLRDHAGEEPPVFLFAHSPPIASPSEEEKTIDPEILAPQYCSLPSLREHEQFARQQDRLFSCGCGLSLILFLIWVACLRSGLL